MKRVVLLSIALALAFACGKDEEGLRGENTKEVQIIISDPTTGPLQMRAYPDPATIGRDGAVKWQIVYKSGPQLETVVIDGFRDPKGPTDPFEGGSRFVFNYLVPSSTGPVQTSSAPNKGGDFKYNVTVTIAGSAPIVFDPRLIVNY